MFETEINVKYGSGGAKTDRIWTFNQIIKFLQFQKERVGKGAIKAATLRNFIKSSSLIMAIENLRN
ncbi:MAG: hypothetical protein WA941_21635 [Nitrososphaeraceae archaeon]